MFNLWSTGPSGGWVDSDAESERWGKSVTISHKLGWVWCDKDCGFGAHAWCLDLIQRMERLNKKTATIGKEQAEFSCRSIFVQLPICDLKKIEIWFKDCDYNKVVSKLKSTRKSFKSYQKRKRNRDQGRYENDLSKCEYCGMLYDLNVKDHLLNDCSAYNKNLTPRPNRSRQAPRRLNKDGEWPNDDVWDKLIFFNTHHEP